MRRVVLTDRISIADPNGCWLWTGPASKNGYGRIGPRYAHRAAYEAWVGAIPDGYQVDHLCRVRLCVNPRHLEAVTQAENIRRQPNVIAQLARTHCPAGHPYSGENLRLRPNNKRACRTCDRLSARRQFLKKKGAT